MFSETDDLPFKEPAHEDERLENTLDNQDAVALEVLWRCIHPGTGGVQQAWPDHDFGDALTRAYHKALKVSREESGRWARETAQRWAKELSRRSMGALLSGASARPEDEAAYTGQVPTSVTGLRTTELCRALVHLAANGEDPAQTSMLLRLADNLYAALVKPELQLGPNHGWHPQGWQEEQAHTRWRQYVTCYVSVGAEQEDARRRSQGSATLVAPTWTHALWEENKGTKQVHVLWTALFLEELTRTAAPAYLRHLSGEQSTAGHSPRTPWPVWLSEVQVGASPLGKTKGAGAGERSPWPSIGRWHPDGVRGARTMADEARVIQRLMINGHTETREAPLWTSEQAGSALLRMRTSSSIDKSAVWGAVSLLPDQELARVDDAWILANWPEWPGLAQQVAQAQENRQTAQGRPAAAQALLKEGRPWKHLATLCALTLFLRQQDVRQGGVHGHDLPGISHTLMRQVMSSGVLQLLRGRALEDHLVQALPWTDPEFPGNLLGDALQAKISRPVRELVKDTWRKRGGDEQSREEQQRGGAGLALRLKNMGPGEVFVCAFACLGVDQNLSTNVRMLNHQMHRMFEGSGVHAGEGQEDEHAWTEEKTQAERSKAAARRVEFLDMAEQFQSGYAWIHAELTAWLERSEREEGRSVDERDRRFRWREGLYARARPATGFLERFLHAGTRAGYLDEQEYARELARMHRVSRMPKPGYGPLEELEEQAPSPDPQPAGLGEPGQEMVC